MRLAQSQAAKTALSLVEELQVNFASGLSQACGASGWEASFERVDWLRDEGQHGGGHRLEAKTQAFNRASVNVSQVHYDDLPNKRLSSATALSTIIHPENPNVPSVHIHISYTELREEPSYWRLMADLNPSLFRESDRARFAGEMRKACGELADEAERQGEQYFYIPALARHRGVSHYYLESFRSSEGFEAELAYAKRFGEAATETYIALLRENLLQDISVAAAEQAKQLEYHTLYLFQVLTLDRGTTAGLLVHDQNDEGILGSLPKRVDRGLLASWRDRLPSLQGQLLEQIVAALPDGAGLIDSSVKLDLARVLREHYKTHPEALDLQARGSTLPPTVQNHVSV